MPRALRAFLPLASVVVVFACGLQIGGLSDSDSDAGDAIAPSDAACEGSVCGASCVDLAKDSKNCGTCDNDCSADGAAATCTGGKCVSCAGIDFMTDPKHCGKCGHDCLGGLCAVGKCQPAVLATKPGVKFTMLAADGAFLFWSGEAIDFGPTKGIYRASVLANSVPGDLILGNVTLLLDVAATGGIVYFSTFSQVGLVGIDGGTSTKIADTNYSYGLFASPAGVSWTNYFASYPTVQRCDLDGGNVSAVVNTGLSAFPHGVVSDGMGTFWVESTRVVRTDSDAGTALATPLVGRNGQIVGIRRLAADSTRLYWTEPSVTVGTPTGRVLSIAKDGSEDAAAATVLGSGQVEPRVLTIDETYVYWTNFGNGPNTGSVMRARKDATQPSEALLSGIDQPIGIANDAMAIYVALFTDPGKVLRLAKDK